MHPELLHALAQERQAELFRQHQNRKRWRRPSTSPTDGATRPLQRLRLTVGTGLVAVGTRLVGNASAQVVSSRR
jgi:hypothetical protein